MEQTIYHPLSEDFIFLGDEINNTKVQLEDVKNTSE